MLIILVLFRHHLLLAALHDVIQLLELLADVLVHQMFVAGLVFVDWSEFFLLASGAFGGHSQPGFGLGQILEGQFGFFFAFGGLVLGVLLGLIFAEGFFGLFLLVGLE